jgi:transposase
MRVLKLSPHLSTEDLKKAMNSQTSVQDFKDYQILYLVDIHTGCKAREIASMLDITSNKVFKTVEKYNKYGVQWKSGIQWGGRREERSLMSLDEERDFLKSIEQDALNGHIINYKQIKSKLEIKLDKEISDDYVWDLFKRHSWHKKVPRKSHPKADKAAQEEYKKNFPNYWLPKN